MFVRASPVHFDTKQESDPDSQASVAEIVETSRSFKEPANTNERAAVVNNQVIAISRMRLDSASLLCQMQMVSTCQMDFGIQLRVAKLETPNDTITEN
jgi:hypothetical protein